MEMRFFRVGDKVAEDMYNPSWHSDQENLADYQSQIKHDLGAHHVVVQTWYLHMENSPLVLPRALAPSNLKGCVGTLKDGYIRKIPLLQAPQMQIPEDKTASAVTCDKHVTCYSQVPCVHLWGDFLARSLSAFGRTTIVPSWLM
jgi:hypothetical protein